jgi:ubiquinone biosynthesis protein
MDIRASGDSELSLIGTPQISARIAGILGIVASRGMRLGWNSGRALLTGRSVSAVRRTWLVDTVTELGPAFIKFAQMMSTRPDLISPAVCRALDGLYDDVRPVPLTELAPLLERRLGRGVAEAIVRSGSAVAAGSIATVYRATLPDGRVVAVKVRRPGIHRVLRRDLALMRRTAGLLAKLPVFRGVPVVEIVRQLTESVHRQLDLSAERDNLERLRTNLAQLPDLRVPETYPELCHEDIVVMEFIEGLHRVRPEDLSADDRRRTVVTALHAVYQMLFQDGLVHCDLHPGNLYPRPDGSVAIVDAGFTVQLHPRAQDKFASFFHQMTQGNGQLCAEIVLSTATAGPDSDTEGFCRELRALVERSAGAQAADFDLVGFAGRLFDIQRRYGLYADPQFVFPILSLLVLEGTVRDFAPDLDFQAEAVPFLVQGTLERAVRAWQATLREEQATQQKN